MKFSILIRLLIYFATITLVMGLIGWFAHVSWQRVGGLQDQLSEKQSQSIRIADHLQTRLLGLNILMLQYAADRRDRYWTNFTAKSSELGDWFKEQQPIFQAGTEKQDWDQINA